MFRVSLGGVHGQTSEDHEALNVAGETIVLHIPLAISDRGQGLRCGPLP
jgi:hypothetical protein